MAISRLRNIGFFGHAGSGKTTIADAVLFICGANMVRLFGDGG